MHGGISPSSSLDDGSSIRTTAKTMLSDFACPATWHDLWSSNNSNIPLIDKCACSVSLITSALIPLIYVLALLGIQRYAATRRRKKKRVSRWMENDHDKVCRCTWLDWMNPSSSSFDIIIIIITGIFPFARK